MTPLDNQQMDSCEKTLRITLPSLYRQLLTDPGWGMLPSGNEIYHPEEIASLYLPFFDDPSQLFNPYLPFGCNTQKQELWVINIASSRAASIWHETVPDDWPDETWVTFEEWVSQNLHLE